MQVSWSQMEIGELIYYETNLAACYEAEYSLSLQYTQNCHCSEPYANDTCNTNCTETLPVEGELWVENSGEVGMETNQDVTNVINQDHSKTRKRPSSSNTDSEGCYEQSSRSSSQYTRPSESGSTSSCSDMIINGDNSLSGRLSPHVKRVCLGLQQCHS